jgi:uncharacterized membrane protein (DUF2068 family)
MTGHQPPPGTEKTRRYLPKLRYELLGCALNGHVLLGTDAAELRREDELFARDSGGLRWYRCLRCDSWLALTPPQHPERKYPSPREEVELPLRGKALRDRYVLRLIAIERVFHFLALGAFAAAVLLFANNRAVLNQDFTAILKNLQGGLGGPVASSNRGFVHDLRSLFAISITSLYLVGVAIAAYAVLEGVEAVGLWLGKRWAEYLTFIATIVFVPYEIYELAKSITALKAVALALNLAVAVYLLLAKRLFGLRGGGKAEQAEHDADVGWPAIERSAPRPAPEPTNPPALSPDEYWCPWSTWLAGWPRFPGWSRSPWAGRGPPIRRSRVLTGTSACTTAAGWTRPTSPRSAGRAGSSRPASGAASWTAGPG